MLCMINQFTKMYRTQKFKYLAKCMHVVYETN